MSKVMLDAMELECDRHQFLVNSYYRCRLAKIQAMHMFLLADAESYGNMSAHEQTFCSGFTNMMQRSYDAAFLEQLETPDSLKRIDKPDMFITPNLDKPVFIR